MFQAMNISHLPDKRKQYIRENKLYSKETICVKNIIFANLDNFGSYDASLPSLLELCSFC